MIKHEFIHNELFGRLNALFLDDRSTTRESRILH